MHTGFTLLEALIYLVLLSILIVAGVASAYAILNNSGRNANAIVVSSEGNFIIRKIDWALSGATQATVSADHAILTVVKGGSTYIFLLDNVTGSVKVNGTILNSTNVTVIGTGGVPFLRIDAFAGKPCGIQIAITVTIKNFPVDSANFQITRYLRGAGLCT